MNLMDLTGKTALVTGGSRGIGFGIAKGLAQAGADLVLAARGIEALNEARDQLQENGRNILVEHLDVLDVDSIPAIYDRVVTETGGIDILVNCAGITRRGPAEELAMADWRAVIEADLTAMFALSQLFARERISSVQRGKIINVASLMSDSVRANNAPYAAAKGGVRQLTKSLAIDWARYGINVNAIGPGYFKTDLTKPLWEDPEFDAWVKQRTPLARWGNVDDLAGAAVFLASDAADFITGQIIYVDGGWLAAL